MEETVFDKSYAEYYDFFNEGKDYSKETNFLDQAIKKYSQIPVKTILDLGCGTGEHPKHLSEKGFSVTGIDLSSEMIEIARKKNISNSEFIVGDMSNFNLNRKFDTVICMFAALGYISDNKNLQKTVQNAKSHLNPGGLFVFDCWNGLAVMNELPSSRTKEFERHGIKVKRTSYPDLDSINHVCKVHFNVELTKENQKKEYKEDHFMRFFFPQEMKKYLEDEGFEILEICEPFELNSKVNEKTWNMAIIARLRQ